jgi:hypothetical protein
VFGVSVRQQEFEFLCACHSEIKRPAGSVVRQQGMAKTPGGGGYQQRVFVSSA